MGDQRRVENRYGLVPVTNTRDFVLVGEDAEGRPAKLETFRLAESAEEFQLRLEKLAALGAVAARSPLRAERPGMVARIVRARRAGAGRGRGPGALAGARVKLAALPRVFGFEIMPAPFVVARAGHSRRSRVGVQMAVCGRGFETTSRGGSGLGIRPEGRGRQCHEWAEDQAAYSLSTVRFTSRMMVAGLSGMAVGPSTMQVSGTESSSAARTTGADAARGVTKGPLYDSAWVTSTR